VPELGARRHEAHATLQPGDCLWEYMVFGCCLVCRKTHRHTFHSTASSSILAHGRRSSTNVDGAPRATADFSPLPSAQPGIASPWYAATGTVAHTPRGACASPSRNSSATYGTLLLIACQGCLPAMRR